MCCVTCAQNRCLSQCDNHCVILRYIIIIGQYPISEDRRSRLVAKRHPRSHAYDICGIAGGITCHLTWALNLWLAGCAGPRRNVIKVSKVRRHKCTKLVLTRPLSALVSLSLALVPPVLSFPLSRTIQQDTALSLLPRSYCT